MDNSNDTVEYDYNYKLNTKVTPLDDCYTMITVANVCNALDYKISISMGEDKQWTIRTLHGEEASADGLLPIDEQIDKSEKEFISNYEERYKAGDLSFLTDTEDGISDTPPELLPYILEEIGKYKDEQGLEELSLQALLFEKDPTTGNTILSLILQRAGAESENQLNTNLVPHIQPVRPQSHTMSISKFADRLNETINEGDVDIVISGRNRRQVVTTVNVTMVDEAGVTLDGDYTEFDRQVQDAIVSLYLYGNEDHIFTPEMVYRAMTNDYTTRNLPEKQLQEITNSIERQRRIHAACDISMLLKQKGYEDYKPKLGDFLLVLRDLTVEIGGVLKPGYYMKEEPLLLEYSKRIGNQIATAPSRMQTINDVTTSGKLLTSTISNTTERNIIRGYLIRRIAIMKNDLRRAKDSLRQYEKKQKKDKKPIEKTLSDFIGESHRILFNTVFESTDLKSRGKQSLNNYKAYIEICLINWKAKGDIKDYKIITGKRKDSKIAADIYLE